VFGSACVVRFGCARPGAASHADLIAASVQEITLNGVRLDPARVCADGGGHSGPGVRWPPGQATMIDGSF
jgi:hypothetical protein